ncbi:hypothetical protein [uncultured Fibrella sp.]|uniref:hypothetical protein n=1 Tax=uncultured Fibrella sp. TaxID=1284596 RepID=UPI0035CBEF36
MEQNNQSAEDNTYTFTPEAPIGQVADHKLIDLTALQAENQANEQAAGVMAQNGMGAAALEVDSLWEYALLRENDREDDTEEVVGAANDAANARHFLTLFRESFQEFRQSAEYGKLILGEQAKWRPTLLDANGKVVGQFNHVLLNPTLPQPGNKPVVQIILPNRDYRQEMANRINPERQQALKHNRPIAFLERRTTLQDDVTVQTLLAMMTPSSPDQQQRMNRAMQEYRQVQATTKPEDVAGLRHSFQQIVQHTLSLQGFRYEAVFDKMLEVNQLQRVTYHPDINVLGVQPIHLQSVPIAYKGVTLQPAQIKNLLLGNSIEVAGLRDERRPGLYRASVQFNVLSNKLESDSKREELRTDSKADFKHHQREVLQRGSDDHQTSQNNNSSTKAQAVSSAGDTIQRPAFRPGR